MKLSAAAAASLFYCVRTSAFRCHAGSSLGFFLELHAPDFASGSTGMEGAANDLHQVSGLGGGTTSVDHWRQG